MNVTPQFMNVFSKGIQKKNEVLNIKYKGNDSNRFCQHKIPKGNDVTRKGVIMTCQFLRVKREQSHNICEYYIKEIETP